MPRLKFAPLIYRIHGHTKGSIYKTTPFRKDIFLEQWPKRAKPINKGSLTYKQRKVYRIADLAWQLMSRAERAPWKAAVKKPYLTGQALWMKEAMYLMARNQFAPDVPSISGGFTATKAAPGTRTRACPPPPPVKEYLLTSMGVFDIEDQGFQWAFKIRFEVNPNSWITNKIGSIMTVWFGFIPWLPEPWCWGWWTAPLLYNLDHGWWCDMYMPDYCWVDNISPEGHCDKNYELKGKFEIDGPNCFRQEGEFSEGSDWHYGE